MGRILLAVFAGLLVGGFCVGLIQSISILRNPIPEGVVQGTPAFNEWVSTLPQSAFFIVEAAHLAGSLVGGFVATKISPAQSPRLALTVGCIMFVFGLMNLLSLPHPTWCWFAALVVYIPPALLGARFASPRRTQELLNSR